MKKLIQGILEFRSTRRENYQKSFAELVKGQSPDTLFIACSDSRVVPNTFASTNPGDLFVVRNVGNLIPCCDHTGVAKGDEGEGAAIEFAVNQLSVKDIIVCGHSECGAMNAVLNGREKVSAPNLNRWLRHAEPSLSIFNEGYSFDSHLSGVNQLSQINVLMQVRHIMEYPNVKERLKAGSLRVHGWWFEIEKADVFAYDPTVKKFVLIDEDYLKRFENKQISDLPFNS